VTLGSLNDVRRSAIRKWVWIITTKNFRHLRRIFYEQYYYDKNVIKIALDTLSKSTKRRHKALAVVALWDG